MTTPNFHQTVLRKAVGAPSKTFSVMQFNVLARQLQPGPVLPNDPVSLEVIKYENRCKLNLSHILAMAPSLLVLEEVDDPAEYYGPLLEKEGYKGFFGRKQLVQRSRPADYTCIYYRPDQLELLRPQKIRYFDPDRTQFVVMAHFQHLASHIDFALVAQHAKAGRTNDLEAVRQKDVQLVLSQLLPKYFQVTAPSQCAGGRILWVADANAGPHTYGGKWPSVVVPWMLGQQPEHQPVHTVLLSHQSPASSHIAPVKKAPSGPALTAPPPELPPSPHVFESAMVNGSGSHPLLTTCKKREGVLLAQAIDYIFFSRGAFRCNAFLPCPVKDPEELAPYYLPNTHWGSDHLSQFVELEFVLNVERKSSFKARERTKEPDEINTAADGDPKSSL